MKRLIAFLMLSLLICTTSLTAQAADQKQTLTEIVKDQDVVNYTTVYNDAKELLKAGATKTDSILTKASRVVGTAAENLWNILVRQQLVNSITYSIMILTSIIIIRYLLKIATKLYYSQDDITDSAGAGVGIFFIGMVIIGLIVFNALHVPVVVMGYVNPEYGALQELYKILNIVF